MTKGFVILAAAGSLMLAGCQTARDDRALTGAAGSSALQPAV